MNTPQFMGVAGATKSGSHTLPVVCQLLFSGVFERFTDIKLLLVESNIGWIPTLLEQVDDMFYRYRFFTNGEGMRVTPSRIFHRNFWATFMIDTVGMDLRHRLNVDQLMWSTRLPAHRLRLAEQPHHDRAQLPRRAEGRGQEDAARQLPRSTSSTTSPTPSTDSRLTRYGGCREQWFRASTDEWQEELIERCFGLGEEDRLAAVLAELGGVGCLVVDEQRARQVLIEAKPSSGLPGLYDLRGRSHVALVTMRSTCESRPVAAATPWNSCGLTVTMTCVTTSRSR